MADNQSFTQEELRATPEIEDFAHKYTEEGNGKIGSRLIDAYFGAVEALFAQTELSLRPRFEAVEIGCGEGFSTQRIDAFLPDQARFRASEFVETMIPKAQANNPHVPILQESAYELKHEDASLDLVFLLEVL
jgi:predicted O-methyltransferase YrrM